MSLATLIYKKPSSRRSLAALGAAVLALASSLAWSAEQYSGYEGLAYELGTGKMLYKESHYMHFVDQILRARTVVYRCPNGQAFGRKRLNPGTTPLVPEFSFEDQRTGHSEALVGANASPTVEVRFRESKKKKAYAESVKRTQKMVADAGFDEFIRRNWAALKSGQNVALDFIVPSQLDYLGFKVKFVKAATFDGAPASVFKLAPSGLLSLLTSGIDVTYMDTDKGLREFAGLSNIRDLNGDNYEVKIDFPPKFKQSFPDSAAFQTANSEVLVSKCN